MQDDRNTNDITDNPEELDAFFDDIQTEFEKEVHTPPAHIEATATDYEAIEDLNKKVAEKLEQLNEPVTTVTPVVDEPTPPSPKKKKKLNPKLKILGGGFVLLVLVSMGFLIISMAINEFAQPPEPIPYEYIAVGNSYPLNMSLEVYTNETYNVNFEPYNTSSLSVTIQPMVLKDTFGDEKFITINDRAYGYNGSYCPSRHRCELVIPMWERTPIKVLPVDYHRVITFARVDP